MYKLVKTLTLIGLIVGIFWLRGGTVSAAAGPFTCTSNFYQVISGQLKILDPLTGNYTDIGSNAGFDYNAIGYNTLDNYMYGIVTSGGQSGDLIRISSDGTTTDLGLPTGLPSFPYVNGSTDLSGNLYINDAGNNTIYEINIGALTATTLTISGDPIVAGDDSVWINNNLYYLDGSTMSVVNLNTDTNTNVTVSGPSGWLTAGNNFGAAWTDQAGELFFSNNDSGSIYQILNYNTPSPTASFEVTGTVTSNNDGANCPLASQSPFNPPVANNDSYTTQFNVALNETTTTLLSNDVGNSLTVTSNTNPAHGTVSVNADGTFLYTPAKGFSGTDSFNYTVTDSFGRTASATVTITVSTPKAPSTGFGMPNNPQSPILGLCCLSVLSISAGIYLLYRQKRIRSRAYSIY